MIVQGRGCVAVVPNVYRLTSPLTICSLFILFRNPPSCRHRYTQTRRRTNQDTPGRTKTNNDAQRHSTRASHCTVVCHIPIVATSTAARTQCMTGSADSFSLHHPCFMETPFQAHGSKCTRPLHLARHVHSHVRRHKIHNI